MPPSRKRKSLMPSADLGASSSSAASAAVLPAVEYPRLPDGATEQEKVAYEIQLNTSIHQSKTVALLQKQSSTPKSTEKTYARGKYLWLEWCKGRSHPDGELVWSGKVCLFLDEVVFPYRKELSKDERAQRIKVRQQIIKARGPEWLAEHSHLEAELEPPRPNKKPRLTKKEKEAAADAAAEEQKELDRREELAVIIADTDHISIEEARQRADDDFLHAVDVSNTYAELDRDGLPPLHGDPVSWASVDGWMSAITDIHENQKTLGQTTHKESYRDRAWQHKIDSFRRRTFTIARETYVDRGINSLTSGYTLEQFLQLQHHLLSLAKCNASAYQHLRTRVDMLLGHYLCLRGGPRRDCELADLQMMKLPDTEGPTPAWCLIMTMQNGKANQFGKIQYMGAMRHKDVRHCSVGAVAQYLFHRWHGGGEPFPSFESARSWYGIKLLLGNSHAHEEGLSYVTQLYHTNMAFIAIGLDSSTKTQAPRGNGARDAELHGIGNKQIARGSCLATSSAMEAAYLTGLPMKWVRGQAGFSTAGGAYSLPRACMDPPASLQLEIFPKIEYWLERHDKHRKTKAGINNGGVAETDHAAVLFLKMLKQMRIILLQDFAMLQPEYPHLPAFNQPLFSSKDWLDWSTQLRASAASTDQVIPSSRLPEQAMPEMSSQLRDSTEVISTQVKSLEVLSMEKIDALHDVVKALGTDIRVLNSLLTSGNFVTTFVPNNAPTNTAASSSSSPSDPIPAAPATGVPLLLPPPPPPALTPSALPIASTCPQYSISSDTVTDLWREWTVGLNRQASIEQLELDHGRKWRVGKDAFFSRRKKIIDEIKRRIAGGRTAEEAVAEVERKRGGVHLNDLAATLTCEQAGTPKRKGKGKKGND